MRHERRAANLFHAARWRRGFSMMCVIIDFSINNTLGMPFLFTVRQYMRLANIAIALAFFCR